MESSRRHEPFYQNNFRIIQTSHDGLQRDPFRSILGLKLLDVISISIVLSMGTMKAFGMVEP